MMPMVSYTVPTRMMGVVTRASAGHSLEVPGYRFVAVHDVVGKFGSRTFATWHSTRELAQRASQYGSHVVEVVEIQPEHMSAKRSRKGA
jgi:hypothetical protein